MKMKIVPRDRNGRDGVPSPSENTTAGGGTPALPSGWKMVRLKDVATVDNGSDPKAEGDVPVYGSGGRSFKTCGEYKMGPAVLLGRKGTIDVPRFVEGKYWNVDTAFDVKPIGGGHAGRVTLPSDDGRGERPARPQKPDGKIDIRYLFYLAHTFDYKFYSTQTTVPSMTQKDYRNMKIPLPPLPEQRRIAAYLDAKCADVDKAIAAKQRQVEMIETLWKNVLHGATLHGVNRGGRGATALPSAAGCDMVGLAPRASRAGRDGVPSPSENTTAGGGTPALPSGWRFEKIARCFDLIGSGTTPKSHMLDYYDGEIPWLQSGDLHGHYIDHTEKCVNERACQECNLRIYKAPFIAIAMYGASIANLSIVKIDACTNQACCTLCQPRYLIDPNFAYFALEASREELLLSAHGGTQPNISREAIRRLKIPLPPLSEQRRIAAYLDAKRAGFDALAGNLRRQVETLEQYRRSLIHECVTGKRRCA